ncbi:MAG TPA: tetratricopeptide repeat protein, partial [Methylomirabilota bacterium]|nr:tetratricopeptide repeat protein [Methylomirabilota bacterium]
GMGGFGEVYRAWDLTLEREVALKLLLPRGLKPEEEFASIVSEARAMARVRHPNTVSVYGVDRHDGRVGLWSDFVRGQTLAQWVDTEGPRSEKETVEIGTQLCDALSAVHHAGLLHRDIKPGNAMRAEGGRILLMDFGLSHELHRETRWGGTRDYMAPELYAGSPPSIQSDIYAMGVLLQFVCTGGHQLGNSLPSREAGPQTAISPALRRIIDTATNVDPRERYTSAAKLHDALATLASPPVTASARKKPPRARMVWITAAVLALSVLALLSPLVRRAAQARFAGTSRAAYQDYLAAEETLLRYDKPGNTEEAIKLYQRTLERSPDFALAHAGLARANWRMYLDTSDKKWASAADQAAARAAAINSEISYVQTTLGMIHVAEGKDSLGTHELERARELDPRSADARAALGEAYRQQGRLGDAKAALQTAMDLAPDDWRWPYWLGALQIDTGDYKSAEKNLKIALEKAPDNARVLYDLGLVYRKQERLDDARGFYERALQLDPQYLPAMVALGTLLRLEGRFSEAVAIYKRAVERKPGNWYLWGKLGDAEQWADHPDEMASDYRKAIELASEQLKITPDDPFLVTNVAADYAALKDENRALPLMRKALQLAPQNPDTVASVAESYELLGNRDEALKLIAKALQLGYSADYAKKTPELRSLRKDPRAPQQIRE